MQNKRSRRTYDFHKARTHVVPFRFLEGTVLFHFEIRRFLQIAERIEALHSFIFWENS